MAINPHKPLRIVNDRNKVTLVGIMPNQDIVVALAGQETPILFTPDGKSRSFLNPGARLENVPEVKSAYYWFDPANGIRGRGMTMLSFIWTEYSLAKYAIQIISQDGVPVDAKFHERPMK